jgi:esterase/lipase
MLEARHRPSGLNSRFPTGLPHFSDYVANTRKMLFDVHSKTATARSLEIKVDGNAPFELKPTEGYPRGREKPYRRGVLLIHGLSDSPYFMRPLAEFFQELGFRVMTVLLPGHGTQPGDLVDIRWQEWARAVAYGVDQLEQEADEIFLAGLSIGAALGILHSQQDSRVRGLMLFSPALGITRRAAWANLHKLYSWLQPSSKWVSIMPDQDIYKYESFPKNAAFQTHRLMRCLHTQLRREALHIPVFAAASADDATVDSLATLEFMAHLSHPANKLVYYTRDPSQHLPRIAESRVELMNSAVPEQRIVSFSHLSIVLPPEDGRYGVTGEYSNCLHYYPRDLEKYAACNRNSPPVLQGEVTDRLLRAGIMRRLMYNPHFAALKISMRRFIETLS